jgi:hypothetical protein
MPPYRDGTPLIITVGEPVIGNRGNGYTQSFISIGAFYTVKEAESCL